MPQTAKKALQNTLRNDLGSNLVVVNRKIESVATWMAAAQKVQRQLCRQNADYSRQYTRITKEELKETLDDRECKWSSLIGTGITRN